MAQRTHSFLLQTHSSRSLSRLRKCPHPLRRSKVGLHPGLRSRLRNRLYPTTSLPQPCPGQCPSPGRLTPPLTGLLVSISSTFWFFLHAEARGTFLKYKSAYFILLLKTHQRLSIALGIAFRSPCSPEGSVQAGFCLRFWYPIPLSSSRYSPDSAFLSLPGMQKPYSPHRTLVLGFLFFWLRILSLFLSFSHLFSSYHAGLSWNVTLPRALFLIVRANMARVTRPHESFPATGPGLLLLQRLSPNTVTLCVQFCTFCRPTSKCKVYDSGDRDSFNVWNSTCLLVGTQ